MISFFKKRRLRKQLKEYLHAARHARHMREDIADPADLAALKQAEQTVRAIRQTGEGEVDKALESLITAADKVYPSVQRTGLRENVEVIIVALGAAMAIRAFFFQPYKIPTGSMQPTLNGITTEAQADATLTDHQPFKFAKWLVTGASYKVIRAKYSGEILPIQLGNGNTVSVAPAPASADKAVINIGGTLQEFPSYMAERLIVKPGMYVEKGDAIARGKVIAGDHILVNKMKYNFMKPDRGDIAVFDTRSIEHPHVRKDAFYIKRMVGLPGERIQIVNNRIVVNGSPVSDPPIFEKIATDPLYDGHVLASPSNPRPKLLTETDVLQLGNDEYLMFGDNTHNSEDGRYFGAVPRRDFQGPAFFVYWPFRDHWGMVH